MALEVNEIGVRLRIYGDSAEERELSGGDDGPSAETRAEIVEACVRQVLRILKAMEER